MSKAKNGKKTHIKARETSADACICHFPRSIYGSLGAIARRKKVSPDVGRERCCRKIRRGRRRECSNAGPGQDSDPVRFLKSMSSDITKYDRTAVPAVLERAGANAMFAACQEFFKALLSNEHTKRAYVRVVRNFLAWCEIHNYELRRYYAGHSRRIYGAASGIGSHEKSGSGGNAAFFRCLGDAPCCCAEFLRLRPWTKHNVVDGKTAEISIAQAKTLFRSLDVDTVVGLRDRAVLGVLAYTGARIGAVANLRLTDYRDYGEHRMLRFYEKGGKEREIPVRHEFVLWGDEYLQVTGIADDDKAMPLFRAADRKRKILTINRYKAHSMRQMLKRRLSQAGLPHIFSPHSFRVTVVTDLLKQDVPLEDVQYLAGHSDQNDADL